LIELIKLLSIGPVCQLVESLSWSVNGFGIRPS
jgi:hypothetical protein